MKAHITKFAIYNVLFYIISSRVYKNYLLSIEIAKKNLKHFFLTYWLSVMEENAYSYWTYIKEKSWSTFHIIIYLLVVWSLDVNSRHFTHSMRRKWGIIHWLEVLYNIIKMYLIKENNYEALVSKYFIVFLIYFLCLCLYNSLYILFLDLFYILYLVYILIYKDFFFFFVFII